MQAALGFAANIRRNRRWACCAPHLDKPVHLEAVRFFAVIFAPRGFLCRASDAA
jgi:hypothetical protein